MTESEVIASSAPATATPKKKAGKPKNVGSKKAAPSHPPTSSMVNAAIQNLKERGGSSLQAIKKYISSTYKVDAEKMAPFIKKYLKSAVDGGALVRTKGKGASGSFKLASKESSKKVAAPKKKTVKVTKPKKEKSAVKKSPSTPKKTASKPKAKAPSKPKTVKPKAEKKSPKKTKAPKTPKSPKPKKTVKKSAPKKAATKK